MQMQASSAERPHAQQIGTQIEICKVDDEDERDAAWEVFWEQDPLEEPQPRPPEQASLSKKLLWQPVLEEISLTGDEAKHDVQQIREATADMARIGTSEGRITGMTEESWQQRCEALLQGGTQGSFKAAEPRRHLAAHQELWQLPGPLREGGKRNTRWEPKLQAKILGEGLRLDFVRPESASQQCHPQYAKRLEAGKRLVSLVRGPAAVQATLKAESPQPADFTNHVSVIQHAEFVMEKAAAMLQSGALMRWPTQAEPPTVISPLGVVEGSKLRIIFDGRYVNLWEKYESFKYEKLADVAEWMQPNFYLWSTDLTDDYHHMPIHQDFWKHLGCRLPDGTVCCFTVLPFGLSSGCRVFTKMQAEIYRPLREAGIRLSFLIDDEMGGAESLEEALFQLWILLRILVALGWLLSSLKCQFWPQLHGKFLGMLARTSLRMYPGGPFEMVFEVPEKKLQLVMQLMNETLQQEQVTARILAKIAGKLLAMAPALELAKLYTRSLYAALKGQHGLWDELHAFEGAWRQELAWLLKVMPTINGRRILKREETVRLVGDAGETGIGVYSPGNELPQPIVASWTEEQLHRLHVQPTEFSSTLRELLALLYALQCIQADPTMRARFEHKRLIYEGDSQAMTACINSMGGNQLLLSTVKQIWEIAFELDIGLEMQWRSRWEDNQLLADRLEKLEDSSDWVMSQEAVSAVMANPACSGRQLTLDVFASDTNTRVPGRFYSKWLCKGTLGVDAFTHPWATREGIRQFCWINGPFAHLGRIFKKIREEQCDAVVIHPRGNAHWISLLRHLPVKDTVLLSSGQCKRGQRLPDSKPNLRPGKMGASIIIW